MVSEIEDELLTPEDIQIMLVLVETNRLIGNVFHFLMLYQNLYANFIDFTTLT